MKEWLTAVELAAEGLPDFPSSERGVRDRAERDGWNDHPSFVRSRGGRDGGGGLEYHYSLLPALAQIAYTQRHMVVARGEAPAPESLSARAQEERDARLAIVHAFQRFGRTLNLGHASQIQIFVDGYNASSIEVDAWVRERIDTISKRTLIRWISAKRDSKTVRLAVDRGAARKGKGVIETAEGGRLRTFILGLIAAQPFLSGDAVRTQCRAEFGDRIKVVSKGVETLIDMPPVRTFQHWIARLKADHRVELTKLTNPDLFKSTMKLSGTGALRHVTEPNQLWQIDASPVDALCTDGRYTIYVCLDIATRRLTLSLSRTPRASAVALLVRKAILAWGLPERIKTDNGTDFVAHDTRRLFAALDIEAELSDAYSPEQKGHVERAIRTFQHAVTPLLPGFVGHSVADRKAIESRKSFAKRLGETEAETFGVSLTGPELQRFADEWANTAYAHRPHDGLNKRTPFQVALASTNPPRMVDERALDLLLMPVAGKDGKRVVGKWGVEIDRHNYLAGEVLPGAEVFVRMDPDDMGRAYLFAEDRGAFLGVAQCAELAGIHPQTFVAAQRELQGEVIAERTKAMREEARRIAKGPALIERALEVARRDAPNVVPLPRRSETHSTPQIAAALDAMTPRRPQKSKQLEGRAAELHRQLAADLEPATPPKVTRLRKEETPQQRFRRARDIELRHEAGEPVTEDELLFLGGYRVGPEYRSMKRMFDEFGEAMGL